MSIKTTEAFIGDDEAPAFTFIDKAHQGKYGDGWRQSRDETIYVQPDHSDVGLMPARWTGEHVIQRLVEAFKTDCYCKLEWPKLPGSSHPQIEYDDDDRAGWQADDRGIVIGPSKLHFARMEQAFGWLDAYFKIDAVRAGALKEYAKTKAYKRSLSARCKELFLDRRTFRDRAKAAARGIALALTACRTPVS